MSTSEVELVSVFLFFGGGGLGNVAMNHPPVSSDNRQRGDPYSNEMIPKCLRPNIYFSMSDFLLANGQ